MPPTRKLPRHGKTHIGTVYLGGIFSDGGGLEISPTKDGGWVLKRIPPRQPVFEQLTAAALLVERAGAIGSPELQERMMALANDIVTASLGPSTEAGS
jgi:hypothetical protein